MKALSGLSLISLLVVMAIVMLTSQKQASTLLPSGQPGSLQFKQHKNPITYAENSRVDMTLDSLYRSANLAFVSNGQNVLPSDTLSQMSQDNPGVGLGKPVASNGIEATFPTKTAILICTRISSSNFRCLAGNFRNGKKQDENSATLAEAKRLASRDVGL